MEYSHLSMIFCLLFGGFEEFVGQAGFVTEVVSEVEIGAVAEGVDSVDFVCFSASAVLHLVVIRVSIEIVIQVWFFGQFGLK